MARSVPAAVIALSAILGFGQATRQENNRRISGVVMLGSLTGAPVTDAIVTLSSEEAGIIESVQTDESGRFHMDWVPEGRLRLTASKSPYLPGAFGAMRPGRDGTAVVLSDAQELRGATIILWQAGAISGTISDSFQRHLQNVQVVAVIEDPRAEDTGARVVQTALTDDEGRYRLGGLAPGEYLVAAIQRAVGSGPVFQWNPGTLDAALQDLQAGRQRGGTHQASRVEPRELTLGPVFYPGVPNAFAAGRISVGTGEQRASVDFLVQPAPAMSLSGRVTTFDGSAVPSNTRVGISATAPTLHSGQLPDWHQLDALDQFAFAGLPVGRYLVWAEGAPDRSTARGADEGWSAATSVDIINADLNGVVLTLRRGAVVSGTLAFDAGSSSRPTDMPKVALELRPLSPVFRRGQPGRFRTTAQPNGTFVFRDIPPGRYQVLGEVTVAAAWDLSAVTTAGADVLDSGITVDGDVTDLRVRFAGDRTEIAGLLDSPAGVPATEYFILAFSLDRTHWREPWRRVASARPALDGSFSLSGLPPGKYGIAVLTDLEDRDWVVPGFLESLVSSAIPVTLSQGLRLTQHLRIRRP